MENIYNGLELIKDAEGNIKAYNPLTKETEDIDSGGSGGYYVVPIEWSDDMASVSTNITPEELTTIYNDDNKPVFIKSGKKYILANRGSGLINNPVGLSYIDSQVESIDVNENTAYCYNENVIIWVDARNDVAISGVYTEFFMGINME